MDMLEMAERAQRAREGIASRTADEKNALLLSLAEILDARRETVLAANDKDVRQAVQSGVKQSFLDRLRVTSERIDGMIEGIRQVVALPDPCAVQPQRRILSSGIVCVRQPVPFGVILMIYESRPNVTIDAAVLGLKSGNVMILRGGKEALATNQALRDCLSEALRLHDITTDTVQLVEDADRQRVQELIRMRGYIDLVIPRGSAGLIRTIVEHSTVPVIETGSGVCHMYIDRSANWETAVALAMNAKVQRPSVCNAMETLLVHDAWEDKITDLLAPLSAAGVEIRGDERVCHHYAAAHPATEADWATEYNDMILAVAVMPDEESAIAHIRRYGTRHSECIVATDDEVIVRFMQQVDAAAIYANASTRFTDGFEFGLGAEIGISTQKMHVRGPMGLDALTTYEYRMFGNGQIRS